MPTPAVDCEDEDSRGQEGLVEHCNAGKKTFFNTNMQSWFYFDAPKNKQPELQWNSVDEGITRS